MKRAATALLVVLAGCRACTMSDGETTYEKIDAPVRISVVRKAQASSMIFSNVGFVLRVETSPPFDEPLDYCMAEKYGIGEDKTGKLLAFRCGMDGEPWRLLRVTAGTHVRDCSMDLGVARKPNFTKVKPIADVAIAILECHEALVGNVIRPGPEVYEALVAQLREAGGSSAVVTFFAKSSDRPFPEGAPKDKDDAWMTAIAALPAAESAAIDVALCPALLDPSKTQAYVRAARRCPLRDPAVVAAALARSRTTLAGPDPKAIVELPSPLSWALPIAATGDPIATHALACAFAKTAPETDSRYVLASAACPALSVCDAQTWDLDARDDAGLRVRAPASCR